MICCALHIGFCSILLGFALWPISASEDLEVKRLYSTSPKNVAKDKDFMDCMAKRECGLESRCSFKLRGDGRHLSHNGSYVKHVDIEGHLMAVKNKISYPIVFFWDVLGEDFPSGGTGDDGDYRYKGVYCESDSITYINTKVYGKHRVRLYTSKIGNDRALLNEPMRGEDLEFMETYLVGDVDCTRYQACRLLDNICYLSTDENKEDCLNYRYVCKSYDDADQLSKEACIPECVSAYWSDEVPEEVDVDSEGVVKCISNGCGVRGSGIDGTTKNSTVGGLVAGLVLSLAINVVLLWIMFKYRNVLMDSSYSPAQEGGLFGSSELGGTGLSSSSNAGYL
jgi:hypothetical protein